MVGGDLCSFKADCLFRSRQSGENLLRLNQTFCDRDYHSCPNYRIQITISPNPETYSQAVPMGVSR
jgi:hypothetical protein